MRDTMTIMREVVVQHLLERLAPLIPDPPYLCWLTDEAGEDYCPTCIEKHVTETNLSDGGWDRGESDHSCSCTDCGCLLAYSLTNYGVEEELAHFYSDAKGMMGDYINLTAPIGQETLYEIEAVLRSISINHPLIGKAIRLADTALTLHYGADQCHPPKPSPPSD